MNQSKVRANAVALGLARYNTGKSCKYGHFSDRSTASAHCLECVRLASKEWRTQLHALEWDQARQMRDRKKIHEQRKVRAQRDRIKLQVQARAYYKANAAKAIDGVIRYYKKNKTKILTDIKAYQKANPLLRKVINANRKARKKKYPGSFTAAEFQRVLQQQQYKCIYCYCSIREQNHADHIVPLSRDGSNNISNIQATCPPCNMRKHAKDPIKFAHELGRLL